MAILGGHCSRAVAGGVERSTLYRGLSEQVSGHTRELASPGGGGTGGGGGEASKIQGGRLALVSMEVVLVSRGWSMEMYHKLGVGA